MSSADLPPISHADAVAHHLPLRSPTSNNVDETPRSSASTDSQSISKVASRPRAVTSPNGLATRRKDTSTRPSPFMTLPRELRDQIYDHISHDITMVAPSRSKGGFVAYGTAAKPDPNWTPRFTIRGAPHAALLRISKQFSAEYQERVQKQAILTIRIPGVYVILGEVESHMRKILQNATHKPVVLHILTNRTDLRFTENNLCAWMDRLKSMCSSPLVFRITIEFRARNGWQLGQSYPVPHAMRLLQEGQLSSAAFPEFLARLTGSKEVIGIELRRSDLEKCDVRKDEPQSNSVLCGSWIRDV